MKIYDRKIVIVNQAVNYLTIGLCNEFAQKFNKVSLITGSVHSQGENLKKSIEISYINRWQEEHGFSKLYIYTRALCRIYFLLISRYFHYEVVFISVPPMAYLLSLFLPQRCSALIWDVYPDIFKITGMKESHPIYRAWAFLNKLTYRRMFRIFTIGKTMRQMIAQYVDREKIIVQPIWSIFQENSHIPEDANPFVLEHGLEGKFVVQYSGNIGVTHNVEVLIEVAERLRNEQEILFQIIGRGPKKKRIERLICERKLNNIQMLPFQSDEMFPYSLSAADLGVVSLHESVSRGSVPSKAYNLMSLGIPGLYIAGADSELARYAQEYGNACCFAAKDVDGIAAFISQLANNEILHKTLQVRAEIASKYFRRGNASRFVESYLAPEKTES